MDFLFTSKLFWILAGVAFVAAELAMTKLIVWYSTRPKFAKLEQISAADNVTTQV